MAGYILSWYTGPKTVTDAHPSINQAGRRVTWLIGPTTIQLRHAASQCCSLKVRPVLDRHASSSAACCRPTCVDSAHPRVRRSVPLDFSLTPNHVVLYHLTLKRGTHARSLSRAFVLSRLRTLDQQAERQTMQLCQCSGIQAGGVESMV